MSIKAKVPKDLSAIKTKVALNLTKRQLICFGGAAAAGMPLYLLLMGPIGKEAAALVMVAAMMPFFFMAMYRKDGMPAEKYLYLRLRQGLLLPGIRRYRQSDIFRYLEEREKMEREVEELENKKKRHSTTEWKDRGFSGEGRRGRKEKGKKERKA